MIEGDCILEIAAKRHDRARTDIERHIMKRITPRPSMIEGLLNAILGIFEAIALGHGAREKTEAKPELTPTAQAIVDEAGRKARSNLFLTDIRIHGNDLNLIYTVAGSLPNYGLNDFKKFKLKRSRVEAPQVEFIKPARYTLCNALSHLWKVMPIAIVALSYLLGFFDPVHFLSKLELRDILTFLLASSSAPVFAMAFKKHNPIILPSEGAGFDRKPPY